jgi:coenzyme Q-binding protein COQ10
MEPVAGRFAADFPTHGCEQLFALAVDIERYPAFIPWCREARIVARHGAVLEVDNHFGAGPIDAAFRTRAMAEPPHRLEITSDQPPFRSFQLVWSFSPLGEAGCRVVAEYRMVLRSPLLHGLIRLTLPEAQRKIIQRFRDRAQAIYGNG